MSDAPWEPPMAGTETEHLLAALDRLRATFRWKAGGLDAAGLRTTVGGASTLTLGGLLKHLAAARRPAQVVRRLTLLQLDPTAAVAPNADLVLWSRLGSAYDPEDWWRRWSPGNWRAARHAPAGRGHRPLRRGHGVLRVDALHLDVDLDAASVAAVHDEAEDLATWLGRRPLLAAITG